MGNSAGGVSSTIESIVGPRFILGTTSYYLVSTVIFFLIFQYIVNQKPLLKLQWSGRRRKTSGNNNTKDKNDLCGGQERVAGLEAVPGPASLPLLGNCMEMCPLSNTIEVTKKWSKMYGPVFRFHAPGWGPEAQVVILNSAPHIQTLLKSTDLGHVTKMSLAYDLMRPFITNGVLVSKGKFWQHERKILLRSMSFQSLRAYIHMLNNHCGRFVDSLDKMFADGGVHTINELINSSFLEVICEMITGFDIHNTSEGVEYHHNFQVWKESIAYRLIYPWNLPEPLWKLNPLSRKNNKAVQGLFDFARRRIAEHREKRAEVAAAKLKGGNGDNDNSEAKDSSGAPTFRSVLDELMDASVPEDQIIDEVNTMLFGGHETGASTIHFFCLAMALNQDIQELCRKEIDDVFGDPMQVIDGRMTYDSLSNLKYVERCVLETLRLYPPVLIFLRQLQVPLRIELEGKPVELPKGVNIGIYPFLVHRREEYFPDPERFDPDRFLPEEMAKRHAYAYVPFSSGVRNCLGLKFAMIEMKMVCAYLLRNFEIFTTDKLEDVKLLPNLTLTPERDYNFIFKRRKIS